MTTSPAPVQTDDDLPDSARRVARALAKIVDWHGDKPPLSVTEILGGDGAQIVKLSRSLDLTEDRSIALLLAPVIKGLPTKRVSGTGSDSPSWVSRAAGDGTDIVVPGSVLFHVLPGELLPVEAVVSFTAATEGMFGDPAEIEIAVRGGDLPAATAWLNETLAELEKKNPMQGCVIAIKDSQGSNVDVIEKLEGSLDDVVVPSGIREELERNVLRHLQHSETLKRAGLGTHRGVLLYGPPGTGKTSLVRGIVNAADEGVTVLVPSPEAVAGGLGVVYTAAAKLAPAIVVLEDIDVVTRSRKSGGSVALLEFLNALDGVLVDHTAAVVTIATTNDPDGMDDAAKRPGRIDRFVEVPYPDEAARRQIIELNFQKLRDAGATIEVTPKAIDALARGARDTSGAVLKEAVRRSLLLADPAAPVIGDTEFEAAAAEVGVKPSYQGGTYL